VAEATSSRPAPAAERPAALAPIPAEVWRVAWVIVFGAFMANLDTSLVNVGLDTISRDLHGSLATAQWVTSGYLLALAAALPACAWLSRHFGTGRLWMYALAGFTITSALCAAAPNLPALIVLRVAQGVTGGLLVPAGQSVLGRAAGPARMGRVMNGVGIAVVLAPALGPAIGGLLIHSLSWRWLFLVNVPVGVITLARGLRHVPRGERGAAGPFDVTGFALVAGGLPLVVYGITIASQRGTRSSTVVLATVIPGALALAAFAWWSLRGRAPLLNLRLLGNQVYAAATTSVFFTGAALFGGLIILPLYYQLYRHESVLATGLLLLSYGAGAAFSMPVGGRLTDRIGGGRTAVAGLAVTLAATVPFVVLDANASMAVVEVLQFFRGIGIGLAGIPAMSAAYASVGKEHLPDATAQVNIFQRVGGALGSALFVVILDNHGVSSTAAFHATFWWITGAGVLALISAVRLASKQRRPAHLEARPAKA
jgi:EmrB/QacA subfamily drug resistance transporter